MDAKLLFTYALTPLHAGTGRGVGVIDLPIAREVATGIPYLPGSSLKGVLRDKSGENDTTDYVFGPSTKNIEESNLAAGAAQFTDQRLLLLPVRSLKGTFAWVTCSFILHRLRRECVAIGETIDVPKMPSPIKTQAFCKPDHLIIGKEIVLEDINLTHATEEAISCWAKWLGGKLFPKENEAEWQTMLANKLVVVHDDIFSYLLQTAMEVVARIRIDSDSKTVAKGQLWYEENLPAESVLWGLVAAQQVNHGKKLSPTEVLDEVKDLTGGVVQLGGNATVGRGLCRLVMG
jgi:CRISPR-associated protein Cmr4